MSFISDAVKSYLKGIDMVGKQELDQALNDLQEAIRVEVSDVANAVQALENRIAELEQQLGQSLDLSAEVASIRDAIGKVQRLASPDESAPPAG